MCEIFQKRVPEKILLTIVASEHKLVGDGGRGITADIILSCQDKQTYRST
jgi:hypothetical protein